MPWILGVLLWGNIVSPVLSIPVAEAASTTPIILEISDLQNIALADAQMYDLSQRQADDMMATITCESGWDANAVSKTDDYGVAQINRKAHPEITKEETLDPIWSLDWMAHQWALGHQREWVCFQKLP